MLAALQDPAQLAGDPAGLLEGWLGRHGLTPVRTERGAALLGTRERCWLGERTVLDGWIDNCTELAAELALASANPAAVYESAVERWGIGAEDRLIGNYAAVSRLDDGRLRLARSPIEAPPLLFARIGSRSRGSWAAASLPGAFPLLGLAHRIDWDELADLLALDIDRPAGGTIFCGLARVPPGSVVVLGQAEPVIDRWYARRQIRTVAGDPGDTAAHVRQVACLIDAAAKAALASARRPAMALSGGLDSPIVAAALLRRLPPGRMLDAITFAPLDTDRAAGEAAGLANEWPVVQRFAALHPRLAIHRAAPDHGGFDYRFREIATLAGCFNPALAQFGSHHGVWDKARALGCDWLFTAAWGNQSFSADGRWSYPEDLRSMHWRRLWRNLAARDAMGDHRSIFRKVLALAVLPLLPRGLRSLVKGVLRPSRRDVLAWNSMLSVTARTAYRRRARKRRSRPAWEGFAYAASRAEAARRDLADNDHASSEITLALELHYGLRLRDVSAYRPLVEYCQALPTTMFVRGGVHRFLARELARGILPDEQRLDPRTARHGSDWRLRMAPRRAELQQTVASIADHPQLGEMLDTGRMQRMLAEFPGQGSPDEFETLPYRQGLAQGLLAAQFVGLVEGRNDF